MGLDCAGDHPGGSWTGSARSTITGAGCGRSGCSYVPNGFYFFLSLSLHFPLELRVKPIPS